MRGDGRRRIATPVTAVTGSQRQQHRAIRESPLQRDGGVRLPCTGEAEVAGETPFVSRLAGDRRLTPPSKREATGAAGRRGRRPLQRDGGVHLPLHRGGGGRGGDSLRQPSRGRLTTDTSLKEGGNGGSGTSRTPSPTRGGERSTSSVIRLIGPHPALRATCPPCGARKAVRAYADPPAFRPLRKYRLRFLCQRQREAGIPRARGRLAGRKKPSPAAGRGRSSDFTALRSE